MTIKETNILKTCSKNITQFTKYIKILGPKGIMEFKPYQWQIKLLRKFAQGLKNENKEVF